MRTRREFMSRVLKGTTTLALSGLSARGRVLGANDRVRIGLIGAGGRGRAILKAAMQCENTEAVAVADVYTRRLEEVKRVAPNARTVTDFRRLLDDSTLDAVLIATPQHQHALNFVPALQAGKDTYQEKTMSFNPDHARRMRAAFESSNRVVQVGIQSISGPGFARARELATPERMGTISALHTHHYRNAPYGGWRRPVPDDCTPENVDWKAFQGEAAPHEFSGDRVINWRFYWDYSGGNVFENMVHQVGFWYKVLGLNIPRSVSMNGGTYFSPNMQVPDCMDVAMDQPENLLFTWNSGFGNRHYGEGHDLLLGNKGTLIRNEAGDLQYAPEGERHATGKTRAAGETPAAAGGAPDLVSDTDETLAHMQNFIDCVRSRKQPNCPFEIGFRSAISCQMAIASYRERRTVRWDADSGEIV